jgi:hypothetical protein
MKIEPKGTLTVPQMLICMNYLTMSRHTAILFVAPPPEVVRQTPVFRPPHFFCLASLPVSGLARAAPLSQQMPTNLSFRLHPLNLLFTQT